MTQRAKLRRLAFIELPSWSRGSRPYSLGSVLRAGMRESLGRLRYNLGAAPVAAKGTTQDYLTHLSGIPVQIMALKPAFSGVVRLQGGPAAGRRRLDANPAVDKAHHRTGHGLFQPHSPFCGLFRSR